MHIDQIATDGYRGAKSDMVYLPPGVYAVAAATDPAAHTVTAELAAYLVGIGKGYVMAAQEPELEPETHWDLDTLEAFTVDELREMAAGEGLDLPAGYVRKDDLISLLVASERSRHAAGGH